MISSWQLIHNLPHDTVCRTICNSPMHPKNNNKTSQKKTWKRKDKRCQDGIPQKQRNKQGRNDITILLHNANGMTSRSEWHHSNTTILFRITITTSFDIFPSQSHKKWNKELHNPHYKCTTTSHMDIFIQLILLVRARRSGPVKKKL